MAETKHRRAGPSAVSADAMSRSSVALAPAGKRLISPRLASEKTSLSMRHLLREAAAGKFPAPVRLGEGRSGRLAFVESEVDDWIEERIATRRRPAAA